MHCIFMSDHKKNYEVILLSLVHGKLNWAKKINIKYCVTSLKKITIMKYYQKI